MRLTKMPLRPSMTQIRFDNISTCLSKAVDTLDIIAKGVQTPFLPVISSTIRSLLITVQVNYNIND
jgi:hypothetical protein